MAVLSKVPVVIRDDYIMYLEWFDNKHWFHTDVFKWAPAVKVKYLEDLNLLFAVVKHPFYAFATKENTKLVKFGKSLGWTFLKDIKLKNNNDAYIYTWSK